MARVIAAGAKLGPRRGPAASVRAVKLRTRISPEETLTGLKSPLRFNLVPKALDQLFLRSLKVESAGPARAPTKGFQMLVEELALVNSQEEAKVLGVASFRAPGAARFPTVFRGASWVRWLGEHWREARFRAVSGISVVAI